MWLHVVSLHFAFVLCPVSLWFAHVCVLVLWGSNLCVSAAGQLFSTLVLEREGRVQMGFSVPPPRPQSSLIWDLVSRQALPFLSDQGYLMPGLPLPQSYSSESKQSSRIWSPFLRLP